MIEKRSCHAAVTMCNKVFVIGGYFTTSCEAFDTYSRKFTRLNTSLNIPAIDEWYFVAFCIGDSIVVFHHFAYNLTDSIVYFYNVKEEKWLNIDIPFAKNVYEPNCIKYYKQ